MPKRKYSPVAFMFLQTFSRYLISRSGCVSWLAFSSKLLKSKKSRFLKNRKTRRPAAQPHRKHVTIRTVKAVVPSAAL